MNIAYFVFSMIAAFILGCTIMFFICSIHFIKKHSIEIEKNLINELIKKTYKQREKDADNVFDEGWDNGYDYTISNLLQIHWNHVDEIEHKRRNKKKQSDQPFFSED